MFFYVFVFKETPFRTPCCPLAPLDLALRRALTKGVPAYPLRSNPGTPFLDLNKQSCVEETRRRVRARASGQQDGGGTRTRQDGGGRANEGTGGGGEPWSSPLPRVGRQRRKIRMDGWTAVCGSSQTQQRKPCSECGVRQGARRIWGRCGRRGQLCAKAVRRGVYGGTEGPELPPTAHGARAPAGPWLAARHSCRRSAPGSCPSAPR